MDREKFEQALSRFVNSPFWVLVQKETRDHIKSFRFNILMVIILLTCLGSLYAALTSIRSVANSIDASQELFLYLRIFSISGENGALPSFITFISLLGPLLGIAMGFDAINSERNNRTLLRIMAQPIPRDYLILAKFTSSLLVISYFVIILGLLVFALGIIIMGLPPTFEEFIRIFVYLIIIILYIGFWVFLSILFSIIFRQAATSALSGIAVWLFFSLFFTMIVNLLVNASLPDQLFQDVQSQVSSQEKLVMWMRLSPNYLFSEITTVLLNPEYRTLGAITLEQVAGAIASPLALRESLMIIWPQVTGILSMCLICFLVAYAIFIRQEIRS